MRRLLVLPIVATLALVSVLADGAPPAGVEAQAQTVEFKGRVFDAASERGIENLQVKFTPPRDVKAPIRLANTGSDGAFAFAKLLRGRYLVEVSQGTTLLYRREVDTAKVDRLDVPLRRK